MSFWHYVTIILLVAKLLGYFPYSWYWVFMPILVLFVLSLISFVAADLEKRPR